MKVAVIYSSQSGNTEMMAQAINEGLLSEGAESELFSASDFNASKASDYDRLIFGSPSMGDEEIDSDFMDPLFSNLESQLGGKEVAMFGSYGWGDGQFLRSWIERAQGANAIVLNDGLLINYTPDDAGLAECQNFGKSLAH